jgi:multicomponent Na+:H+ antiporter subunit D
VFVGLLTLLSMLKIWSEAFWKPGVEATRDLAKGASGAASPSASGPGGLLLGPVIALVILATAIGVYPRPLLVTAQRAASELLDRTAYVENVLAVSAPLVPGTSGEEPDR